MLKLQTFDIENCSRCKTAPIVSGSLNTTVITCNNMACDAQPFVIASTIAVANETWSALQAPVEEKAAPIDDGWLEWKGGERQVTAYAHVDYRTRNGFRGTRLAWQLDWGHKGFDSDIIAYRVVPADSTKSDV